VGCEIEMMQRRAGRATMGMRRERGRRVSIELDGKQDTRETWEVRYSGKPAMLPRD
jgi:hypothetical protein